MKQLLVLVLAVIAFSAFAQAIPTISSYNVEPSPVIPGQNFTLYAYVYNGTATPATDVVFSLELGRDASDTSFPFSIEPTDTLTRNLGTIPPFTTVQVKYIIRVDPAALNGSYPMQLRVGEAGQPGGTLEATIQVLARNPVLSIIELTPSQIGVGETATLNLSLKNTGSSRATDVIVSLREDRTVTSGGAVIERDIVPLGASSQFIASLMPGETSMISIPVLVNPSATSRPYFIPVTLDFYDENKTQYTTTEYLGLKVVGQPSLGLIVADAEPLLTPGKMSRLTIDLFNNGLGPAKFVQARVSSNFFSIPTNEFFIGTIESDDFDSLVLDGVVAANTTAGDHPVNVMITYKNEFGETTVVDEIVNVHVYNASEVPSANGGNDFPLWIIVIVVLAAGYWWFKVRKPKNGK